MNRRHAIIEDNWVIDFFYPESKEEVMQKAQRYVVLDVEDQPDVAVDWFYAGNKLVPDTDSAAIKMIESGLARNTLHPSGNFGENLVREMRDKIGARNLRLGITESQISGLVSNLATVRFLLEGAALKTARSVISAISPAYPQYSDILQEAVDKITKLVGP